MRTIFITSNYPVNSIKGKNILLNYPKTNAKTAIPEAYKKHKLLKGPLYNAKIILIEDDKIHRLIE